MEKNAKSPKNEVEFGESDAGSLLAQDGDIVRIRSELVNMATDSVWYSDDHVSTSSVLPEVVCRLT